MARRRVLFVAENVTLAQVVRLVTLAGALDPDRYDVHFACSEFDSLIFESSPFTRWPIHTVPRWYVDRAIRSGRRIYDGRILKRYVREELDLLQQIRPHLVVGDFRQSLTVSAPVAGVPYANLINAYWSPNASRDAFPLPDHPMVRLLGEPVAARHFRKALPWVFDHFARPVNALREEYGLPRIGSLPEVLTAGDYTLFPDVPSLVPTRSTPPQHVYLGPVLWAPSVPPPDWWSALDSRQPTVYVTLGSSGRVDLLPTVVAALSELPITVLLATAGRSHLPSVGSNFRVADYLPGDAAARRSDLVISNGGSSTGYQALAEGKPVIGIPYNLDQYLAMQAIERYGAGVSLRSGSLTVEQLRAAVALVLSDARYPESARRLCVELQAYDASARFADFVDRVTSRVVLATRAS